MSRLVACLLFGLGAIMIVSADYVIQGRMIIGPQATLTQYPVKSYLAHMPTRFRRLSEGVTPTQEAEVSAAEDIVDIPAQNPLADVAVAAVSDAEPSLTIACSQQGARKSCSVSREIAEASDQDAAQ
ncbi:hypothetical protein [Celeribacter marinus]|uniref:Uncharacterized protein n=1 Tax=Celeribacter marinus TaxID=1397108 RepID=A0A0N7HJ35_9RHOB|nr:hypothetical protein [Celeribacter marinus]ALI56917.1 hypothetical protein IMCC12053_2970 [Celeribacter marinus]SFK68111.1 hypothetical protein SAMN05444421_10725 [Celeribacter marinus]